MRVLAFSDIHGNGAAFDALERHLTRDPGLDAPDHVLLFLGDLCGYYFDALRIFPRLAALPNLVALPGNHDQMFLAIRAGDAALRSQYLRQYGPAMEELLDADHDALARWLTQLPAAWTSPDGLVHATHEGPAPASYIYPDTPLDTLPVPEGVAYRLLGHSHYRYDRPAGSIRWLNPGSLGQPRDGHCGFMSLDTCRDAVTWTPVPFDVEAFIASLSRHTPGPAYLVDVLRRKPLCPPTDR